MSYVTPLTPPTPLKHPHMTITNVNYEGSYLPGVICNIVVKADLGRSASRSTPLVLTSMWSRLAIGRSSSRSTLQMHYGIYIMGCIWQPFWIYEEKVGISIYYGIIRLVNSQLALCRHVRCNPLDTCQKHPLNTPKWQLQITIKRVHICQA